MDTASREQIKFHTETLPRKTKKALDFLSTESWLGQASWYLAGGTALALYAGHRKSVDLDFFMRKSNFESAEVLGHFEKNKDWKTTIGKAKTIYGALFGAKVSFIAYPFFIPKQSYVRYGTINVLQPLDIAVMKTIAISQRGKKRDFFDLYWCAHHIEPLEVIIKRLKTQYPSVAHDYHHILKSLVYFDDAEGDPEPQITFSVDWKKVKAFFEKEIPIIMDNLV